jgi:hypothetical protein
MHEKIGHVRNPLTIIAIFASIVEISGTVVLPRISEANQGIYIWFLMLFSTLLIGLFFYILWSRHHVLYAPSDFKDESHFINLFQPATRQERIKKFEEEMKEVETEILQKDQTNNIEIDSSGIPEKYFLAEELVLDKLTQEYGNIDRHYRFKHRGTTVVFDGVIEKNNMIIAIEIKIVSNSHTIRRAIVRVVERLSDIIKESSISNNFSLLMVIVTDSITQDYHLALQKMDNQIESFPFPVNVQLFSLEELKKEFGLSSFAYF